jgi:tetratricopeptide (TPR) repeat protein
MSKNYSNRVPAGEEVIHSLGYAVFHREMSLKDALAELDRPQALDGVTEADIELTDRLIDSASSAFPDLAYALAVLNYAAAGRLAGPAVRGTCALRLGTLAWHRCQPDEAIPWLKEAADLCRQAGNLEGESIALGNLGNALFDQGQMEQAVEVYDWMRDLARRTGNRAMAGITSLNLGNVFRAQGRFDEALSHYQRALQAARDAGDAGLRIACLEKIRDTHKDRTSR